jgi:hypothetical protein
VAQDEGPEFKPQHWKKKKKKGEGKHEGTETKDVTYVPGDTGWRCTYEEAWLRIFQNWRHKWSDICKPSREASEESYHVTPWPGISASGAVRESVSRDSPTTSDKVPFDPLPPIAWISARWPQSPCCPSVSRAGFPSAERLGSLRPTEICWSWGLWSV